MAGHRNLAEHRNLDVEAGGAEPLDFLAIARLLAQKVVGRKTKGLEGTVPVPFIELF